MLAEKIKVYKKRLEENTSKEYRIFITIFICLMLVFTTSKVWLPSDVAVQNTAMGETKETSGTTQLTLRSWKYNWMAGFMEVDFDVKNSDSTEVKFLPSAHSNRNRTEGLPTEVVYYNDGFMVIRISKVPQNWEVVSLWIKENLPEDSASSSAETTLAVSENGANFLCDSRRVEVNNQLKIQSEMLYALKSIDNQIDAVKKNISAETQKIEKANTEIQQLKFDIAALKANQKYQTPDDVNTSNSTIQNKESQINDKQTLVADCKKAIANDNEKLKKLKQKRDDTRRGKFTEPFIKPQENSSDLSASSVAQSSTESDSVD